MTLLQQVMRERLEGVEIVLRGSKKAPVSVDAEFHQMMIDRIIFGYWRYEVNAPRSTRNYLKRLKDKLKKYEKTKNRELLVDIANYAEREFRHPSMRGTFFKPEESHGRNKD